MPAIATVGPASWLTQRIIGATQSGWVVLETRRVFDSQYEYSTVAELLLVDRNSGCPSERRVIAETKSSDADAEGIWKTTRAKNVDNLSGKMLSDYVPVVPSGWSGLLKLQDGALVLTYDDKEQVIVSKKDMSQWMEHFQIDIPEEVELISVWEGSDAWRNEGPVLLELETTHRDIDVDYVRFVFPLELRQLIRLIAANKYKPELFAEIHTQPWNCKDK